MDRILKSILSETERGREWLRQEAAAKRAKSARRSSRSPRAPDAKPTKKQKRITKVEARRSTRPLVEARENGVCAVHALGGCEGRLVWDHFFGRGKVPPSVELEWMLCDKHNRQKTDWRPSRAYWLGVFLVHATFRGYEDAVRRCDAALAIENAQHPARREEETTP